MMLLKENSHKKMKVLKVEVRTLVFPLLSEEHYGYTTFPQVKICLSTQTHHLPQLNNTQTLPRRFRSWSPVCHHLVFTSSDEESPERTSNQHLQHHSTPYDSPLQGRAEPPSQVQHHRDYHYTSTPNTDDPFQDPTAAEEEDFPTALLDDDIWLDPVADRHLGINEQS